MSAQHSIVTRGLRALALSALCLVPAAAVAQGPAMPPPGGGMPGMGNMPPEVMQAMQIQQRLQQLHMQVLQDPALATQRDALHTAVKAAIQAKDPQATAKMAQLDEMQKQAAALQAAGKTEELQKLANEGRALVMSLQTIEREVLQSPALAKQLAELDEAVRIKMRAMDPKVPEMEAQLKALAAKMQAAQGGGPLKMPAPQR